MFARGDAEGRMSGTVRFVAAATLGIAVVALAGSPAAHAKGKKGKVHWDRCTFSAHGSDAEKEHNGKPSGGGGGGGNKPEKVCGKVFAKWSDGVVTVYVSNSGAPAGMGTALSSYTDGCFDEWMCHSGLTVDFVNNAADADITITWGDLGAQGILGQTSTSYFGGLIASSSVVMNSNQAAFDWTLGPAPSAGCQVEATNGDTSSSNYDVFSVLLHEIGHAIGISHPTNRCSSRDACYHETMNPCTDAEEYERRALNAGDILAVQMNYGQ
jgi:hypothetical protein